jgi:hypothetical protein
MKLKRLLFSMLITAVAFVALSFAPSNQQAGNDGMIRWQKTTHDFGAVVFNKAVQTEFRFTNISKHPVVITRVVPSCGCTVPQYDEAPIMPGRDGVIKTSFNADTKGMFNKKITVLMDVGTYEVFVRGQVVDN